MKRVAATVLIALRAIVLGVSAAARCAEGADKEDPSVVADFAARDALPQSTDPVSAWPTLKGWGPHAAAYPVVAVPPGQDPVAWKRARVIAVARKYIGLPYRHHHVPDWEPSGEADPHKAGKGLDCSNFSAWVYNYGLGLKFTSDIAQQADGATAPGRKLSAGEAFAPGDLLFILKGDRTCVSHVVIYIDEGHIIDSHAEGVAVRPFVGWYTSHLSHARRLLE